MGLSSSCLFAIRSHLQTLFFGALFFPILKAEVEAKGSKPLKAAYSFLFACSLDALTITISS
jgi:hypothetical protein